MTFSLMCFCFNWNKTSADYKLMKKNEEEAWEEYGQEEEGENEGEAEKEDEMEKE